MEAAPVREIERWTQGFDHVPHVGGHRGTGGIVEVDISEHEAAWNTAAAKTRKNLTGRLYSKSLLDAVEAAVASK